MNRRNFLKTVMASTALVAFPKAYAVEPTTVFTAIQMGLTAASLFGAKGADLGDLMKAQTEILLSISRKIDTIMSAIKVLDARLEELKLIVEGIPNETVKALRISEINGSSNRVFTEVLPGYILDKEKLGILQANAIWIPKVKVDILPVLANARSQLMLLDTPFAVPAMCSALTTERAGLAFTNASEGEAETVRNIYVRYFLSQIEKCNAVRSSIRESLKERWSKIENERVDKRICLVVGSGKAVDGLGCPMGSYTVQVADYKPAAPVPRRVYLRQQPAYSELFAAGYLEDMDLPPDLTSKYARAGLTDSMVNFRDNCPETNYQSKPIPFDELLRLAGNTYGRNIARTLYESGRACPPPESIDSASPYAGLLRLVSEYEGKFNEFCFYSSMQYASERAVASLAV